MHELKKESFHFTILKGELSGLPNNNWNIRLLVQAKLLA